MRRRSVLALLGSTLGAGCSGFGPTGDTTESPIDTPSPTDTPPDTGTPPSDELIPDQRWSLVEFETLPRTVSASPTRLHTTDGASLTVQFARTATSDGPALLRGAVVNEKPYDNTFELRRLPLFDTVPTAWPGARPHDEEYTYRDELILAPTENHAIADTVPDWELAEGGRWRLAGDVDGPWLPETHRLAAGEWFRFEYALVGREVGSGFPAERYQFTGHGSDTPNVGIAVWDTERPGPSADSRFAGADPDPLPEAANMAWYHDADAETTSYLAPNTESIELPETVGVTLRNHSHEVLSGNPYFWKLWKRVDGKWFHVAPWEWVQPLTRVPPGGVETWSLVGFNGKTARCEGAWTVGHLGGGRYAFQIGIGRDDRTHAALLDVEAPPASLEATVDLDVTSDGSTVLVYSPRREDEVPRATLTLTRAESAETRLITEQVMQHRNRALRNTLAFWGDSVDRVELVTDRNTVSKSARTRGYEDGSFRFRYDGMAFEATAEFDE